MPCSMGFESLEAFRHISKTSRSQKMCLKLYSLSVSDGDSPIVSVFLGVFHSVLFLLVLPWLFTATPT